MLDGILTNIQNQEFSILYHEVNLSQILKSKY